MTLTIEIEPEAEGDHAAFVDALFRASAEATRHVWDTPEEDAAWAHLQKADEHQGRETLPLQIGARLPRPLKTP